MNFKFPDGSHSASDIQGYVWYIIKKHQTETDNSPKWIFVNKIENRITFRITKEYYLKHLTTETMKLLESTEKSN